MGDVAIFRHSHFYQPINSTTKGIKFENGEMLDLNAIISSTLADGTHVWVLLKGNILLYIDNRGYRCNGIG